MTWMTLGEALGKAAASGFDDGDAGAGTPAVSRKGPEQCAPAKVTELRQGEELPVAANHERMNVALPRVSRRGPTLSIESAPPLCVGPRLVLIEGGRREAWEEEGPSLPASYAQTPRRDGRAILRLVAGRDHATSPF